MFSKNGVLSFSLIYATIAAIAFCIPCLFFLMNTEFSQLWLLYLGNALFLGCMIIAVLAFSRRFGGNVTTKSLLVSGHVITLMGVLIASIITLIMLLILIPELFKSAPSGEILERKPANSNNILFVLALNTIVGNFFSRLVCVYDSALYCKT